MSGMTLEERIARALLAQHKTLSIAESCTGGLLSNRLTNIPGSSGFLLASVISYSNAAKTKLLKVPEALIRKHGAVSEAVAMKMADGAQRLQKSDFGIGITGIAGPDGGSRQKPVGLVFIAVTTPTEQLCAKCRFKGNRLQIKRAAATEALRLLGEFLF